MLKKFELTDDSGEVFVNPDDVSTVCFDSLTEGARINLRTGKSLVAKGAFKVVAEELGYALKP